MSRLTIETRLNLLVGALLVLALVVNMLVIVRSAGPRIRAESESMVNLARLTLDRGLAEMQTSPNPQRELAGLVERLSGLRHVHIYLDGAGAGRTRPGGTGKTGRGGAFAHWLEPLIHGEATAIEVPATIAGFDYGKLVIVSDPGDELAEISDSLAETATGGLLLIAAVFALTRLAVRQALKPIAMLSTALSRMQQGDFSVRLPTEGPADFTGICANVNTLATALTGAREENRRLAQELISIEDQERRELAAELHDEFGPYLFAIRASATSLMSSAGSEGPAAAAQREKISRALLEHAEAVQKVNRRVLHRLRPPALAEIGLEGALHGLVAQWREGHPEVAIETAIDLPRSAIDETAELTVYRVVQEGLTNAFRHASASRIEIAVSTPRPGWLAITVSDNGTGKPADMTPGFGLLGMRDRVLALGGTLEFSTSRPLAGLRLAIELPIALAGQSQETGRRGPANGV